MFKFLKKTSKKLAWTAFGVWKDKKIQKTKASVASTLDSAVDGMTLGARAGLFGWIVVTGCAAGAFVLLPMAYCMEVMGKGIRDVNLGGLRDALLECSEKMWLIGGCMGAVLVVVLLGAVYVSGKKKRELKSKIDDALRD